MASLEDIRNERIEKLNVLKEAGRNPYPSQTTRTHTISTTLDDFTDLLDSETDLTIAGRVMAIRKHGGSIFIDMYDGSGEIQCYIKQDIVGDDSFDLFDETIDIGDFIECDGHVFKTNRDEESIKVDSWDILAKSLRPLPEKWHGLQDTEKRLRHRYLDILFNDDVRGMVKRRSAFWRSVRSFLEKKEFMEVETPVLENTPGGAEARPFETHHNALDMDVYLRISAGELWQKELMVAGFNKVFEIGRVFRNEGISAEHLQDYTQMEFYWAYADYTDGMSLVKELFRHIAKETYGTTQFTIGEHEIDLSDEWEQFDYVETIVDMVGIDVSNASLDEVTEKLDELHIHSDTDDLNRNRAVDSLWKYCRKQISGPGFLVNVPTELSPLAKQKERNREVAEQFQPIIAGSELGKGYSELNDPLDQAKRFEEQAKMREEGDEEAQMYNDEFIEALEYGMPPTCGFGMSERVFAFLEDLPVREAQIFPLMRPQSDS